MLGIQYSPSSEQAFRDCYDAIAEQGGRANMKGDLVGFSDSDFAGCSHTFKSTTGSILYFKGTPVAWRSQRQAIRAYSTCEAEYIGIFDSIRLTQAQGFLDWFIEHDNVPLIFSDNQSALKLSESALVTKRSKHFMLRYHLVRDHFRSLCFCPGDINRADGLTKPVPARTYIEIFKNENPDEDLEDCDFCDAFLIDDFMRPRVVDIDVSALCVA